VLIKRYICTVVGGRQVVERKLWLEILQWAVPKQYRIYICPLAKGVTGSQVIKLV
jgi:hypothetical protein